MTTRQPYQRWNIGADENEQLTVDGPDQRRWVHQTQTNSIIFYIGTFIESKAWSSGVASKEGSKVINRDWVNQQACGLSLDYTESIIQLRIKLKEGLYYGTPIHSMKGGSMCVCVCGIKIRVPVFRGATVIS